VAQARPREIFGPYDEERGRDGGAYARAYTASAGLARTDREHPNERGQGADARLQRGQREGGNRRDRERQGRPSWSRKRRRAALKRASNDGQDRTATRRERERERKREKERKRETRAQRKEDPKGRPSEASRTTRRCRPDRSPATRGNATRERLSREGARDMMTGVSVCVQTRIRTRTHIHAGTYIYMNARLCVYIYV